MKTHSIEVGLMLTIKVEESSRGLLFRHGRKRFALAWPADVWQSLPDGFREVLADNLAYLLTIDLPLAVHANDLKLNRPRPCFWAQFRDIVTGSLPQAVEGSRVSTTRALERFRTVRYRFESDVPRIPPQRKWNVTRRAVVLVSGGAGSLASLGLARELGLDPVALHVDDTASPAEERARHLRLAKLKELGYDVQVIMDRAEQLDGPKAHTAEARRMSGMHRITAFTLEALPIARLNRAGYIVLGDTHDANTAVVNKDGFLTYPAFSRTSSWAMQLDMMTRSLTGGAVRVTSLVEPLSAAATETLLEKRYPELAALVDRPKARGLKTRGKRAKKQTELYSPGTVPLELRDALKRILMDALAG